MDKKKLYELLDFFRAHAYIKLSPKNVRCTFKRYLFRNYSEAITYLEFYMKPKYKLGGGYIIRDNKDETSSVSLAQRIYDSGDTEPVCIIFKRYKNLGDNPSKYGEITDVIIIQFVDF